MRYVARAVILLAWAAPLQAAPLYHFVRAVPLGPPDGWDYLSFDGVGRRIYVAHGSEVTVLDSATLTVAGRIGGFQGAHGIAVVGGHGVAASGRDGAGVLFDAATLRVRGRVPTAPDADSVTADPATGRVFVVNGDSGSVTRVDPASGRVEGTTAVGGSLEEARSDGAGHVFVNQAEPANLVRLDARTGAVTARWPAVGCVSPHGLALDVAGHRAFVTCANAVMLAVDTETGRVAATVPIGRGTDGAGYDAKRRRAFSSNGEGTVSVIGARGAGYAAMGAVATAPGARTMTIDPETGRLYVVTAEVAGSGPPRRPGGPPSFTWRPGTVKLLAYDPE